MRFNKTILLVAIAGATTDAFAPSHRPERSLSFVPSSVQTTSSTSLEGVRSTFKRVAKAIRTPTPQDITNGDVRSLFYLWNDALATGDSAEVASLYAKDGFLLPTVSDVPRTDFDSIKDYFDTFLQLKPQGKILEGQIKIGKNWAKDAGIYEFTMGKDGSKVKARYSFIYVYEDGEWKISHHHSSAMPEASKGEEVTKDYVRYLFGLWNDALATLDPDKVTERYSKSPVLLPTVSDEPRTDYDEIKDYFVNFLKLEPQGTIIESHVTTGPNWAKDAGVYEFKMGSTGETVKARYTFVYVYEDGEWKIAHHHSSKMPESGTSSKEEKGKDEAKGFSKFWNDAIATLTSQTPESSTSSKQLLTEVEVKDLFKLWNDALATLDSDAVAMRYSKEAVLLPTVSDTPRTDYDSIKDYFDNFLELKPQGKILESHQTCGDGWCKDVGIYEFTMGANNSKVKARYSFVYVYEDGEWKISHHHSSAMPEESKGKEISDGEVRGLFGLWNDALATLEPEKVAARYSKSPVLLPTVSDEPRTDFDGLVDYFTNFLKLEPQGTILESHVTKGPNWAKDAGIYEFNMGSTGDKVKARYSFVYVYEDGEWKIAHHHSSQMPESGAGSKKEIADEEVKGLFYLWNDALATLDSDAVAMRYAKNAVLLPTVSDTPRTDYDTIKDYFDNFLKLKPQGKILESYSEVGDNWCKDVGIYEFTMGADGSKVKARYSFVYVFEDGEWKISHHHSSAMPEESKGMEGKQLSKDEVRSLFGLWNDALATLEPEKVAARYSKNPVLLPTVSDEPRTDFSGLKDYFTNFLKLEPQGTILMSHVTTGPNWAKDAGIYEFKMGSTGDKVKARYSFVYVYEDGEWKIAHHHSSQMPESGASGKEQITEKEVEGLFDLWNDALATLDSDAVAMRYAKNAVLLPTVSDTPRTDYDSIKDYFDTFLQKQPQGKILERYTLVGDNWCKDVGIYEFKMGADGSKVKARYSFVYVFEDGEWKISHHHSSAMPEPMLEAAAKVEESKSLFSV